MHYSDYTGDWTWENFSPKEVACNHCGEIYVDEVSQESMDAIQYLRELWQKPIILTSAHRCEEHNKAVGGSINSQHLRIAFDCICPKEEQKTFVAFAQKVGFRGIGIYPKRGFVHLDMGVKRTWKNNKRK